MIWVVPSSVGFADTPEGKAKRFYSGDFIMKCKNCGARINEGTKICPNCGANISNSEGYVLSTDDDIMFDIYSDVDYEVDKPKKKKKGGAVIRILSILLTLIIIGGGAFYYFTNIYNPTPDKPELSFKTGSGIINDDEKIIYVLPDEKSNIEFIHGVSLYDYDKTDKNAEKKDPITKDYQYTKSIDSSMRAIFFNVDELDLKSGENTCTFEMRFSFYGSSDIFTYLQPITFTTDITEDAASIIFDHSVSEETTSSTAEDTQTTQSETTTEASSETGSVDFIYNSYWFTEPVQNGEEYIISAIKFNKDNSYVSTNYYKNGDSSWEITTFSGKFKLENGFAVLNNGEATENTFYKIDTEKQSLYEEENGTAVSTLTSRKYNSIKNAEDFFGI